MKKIIPHIKKFFEITFALYTCVSFGMMLLNIAFADVIAGAPQWSGVALLFLQILLFSAICALAVTVIDAIGKLNRALGHILKFILCYGAFYLCFFVLVKGASEPINVVVISTAFILIYAVVVAVCAVMRAIASRDKNGEDYENIYSDNK